MIFDDLERETLRRLQRSVEIGAHELDQHHGLLLETLRSRPHHELVLIVIEHRRILGGLIERACRLMTFLEVRFQGSAAWEKLRASSVADRQ